MLKVLAYSAVFTTACALLGPGVPAVVALSSDTQAEKVTNRQSERPKKEVTIGPPLPKELDSSFGLPPSTRSFVAAKREQKSSLASPTPIPTFAIHKVSGVKCDYIDTDRIAKRDDGSCYTKMREEPDTDSERITVLENGDKIEIKKKTKEDEEIDWVYAEIISSKDEERIGEKGYIEKWIVTDKDVPLEEDSSADDETAQKEKSDSPKQSLKEKDVVLVSGVQTDYMYTYRVDEDKKGAFTKMREEADVQSDRIGLLRNGEKFQVLKQEDGWIYGEIISSKDKKQIGKKGYIEEWLLTDQGVPPKPTATPVPEVQGVSDDNNDQPPAPVNANIMSGDARIIFDKVNGHRQSIGMPPLAEDPELCGYAAERAPEINDEIFGGSYVHAGYRRRGLSGLGIVENQVGMGSVDANFNWWMNSGLHRGSIEGNFSGTCVACVGPSCIQLFR
jgi:uncharacterized protein YkwD